MNFRFLLTAAAGLLCAACSEYNQFPIATVGHVDLPRYAGRWYVVGAVGDPAKPRFTSSTQDYVVSSDQQTVDLGVNWQTSANGESGARVFHANVTDPGTNSQWEVPNWFEHFPQYEIMDLDPDGYRWVAVGTRSRTSGWILSRHPRLSDAQYAKAAQVFANQGYDVSRLMRVGQ